jgi:REP element-mobilizing transposase RayT
VPPVIVGYHVSFGAYGFWLPNDPRGSWSEFVGKWELYRVAGEATKTIETRSLAHRPHDREKRLAAKAILDRPPVQFTAEQTVVIGRGLQAYVEKSGLPVWACAVMPDHVHIVFGLHRLDPEAVVNKLKGAATTELVRAGVHPFQHLKPPDGRPPKCFERGEWVIFLDPEDVAWHIEYVESNPIKAGLPSQRWEFVRPPKES